MAECQEQFVRVTGLDIPAFNAAIDKQFQAQAAITAVAEKAEKKGVIWEYYLPGLQPCRTHLPPEANKSGLWEWDLVEFAYIHPNGEVMEFSDLVTGDWELRNGYLVREVVPKSP